MTFSELGCDTIEDELTGLDGNIFSNWPVDIADKNRLPGILLLCTSYVMVRWQGRPTAHDILK